MLLALSIVSLCIFLALLLAAIWVAGPDQGTSSWSTVANIVQLTLVLAGGAASLAALASSHGGAVGRAGLLLAAAIALWLAWGLFLATGIGDSSVA